MKKMIIAAMLLVFYLVGVVFADVSDAEIRKVYAEVLETKLLDTHMDATITVQGKENTTLKWKWIGMNRVFLWEFTKMWGEGSELYLLEGLGFKKVIFTNGYGRTAVLDLTKKKWLK